MKQELNCSFTVSVCVFCLRLTAVRNLVAGRQLMTVLLRLFTLCLKVKANRQELVKGDMNSISIMLGALNLVSVYSAFAHLTWYVTWSCTLCGHAFW